MDRWGGGQTEEGGEGQFDLERQIGKLLIEVEYLIDQFKVKIVRVLTIELEGQCELGLLIEVACKTDLEVRPGQQVEQVVPTIVQVFHLA